MSDAWIPGENKSTDGLYGLQVAGGEFVVWRSHECGKITCRVPAEVAVFGRARGLSTSVRVNTCRGHVKVCMSEMEDAFICALIRNRELGDYCPHCAALQGEVARDGEGHLSVCPIGLTFPDFARRRSQPLGRHDREGCEVCSSYAGHRSGPTG